MSKHEITAEQVRKIEQALEERKKSNDRRDTDDAKLGELERRESSSDRRRENS